MLSGIDKKSGRDLHHTRFKTSGLKVSSLLIQLLFNRLFCIFGAQGTPESVGAFTSRSTFPASPIAVVSAIYKVILVTSLDGVRDEHHGAVCHQYVCTTLVVA